MIKVKMTANSTVGNKDFVEGTEYLISWDIYDQIKGECRRIDNVDRSIKTMNSILIAKSNGLGNVINITPLIKKIKLLNPEINIDMLVLPAYKEIFQAMKQVRNVYDPGSFEKAEKKQWDLVIQGIPADFALPGVPSDRIITGETSWFKKMHEVEANIKILEVVDENIDYVPDTFVSIPTEKVSNVSKFIGAAWHYIGICAGYTKNQAYWKIKHWGDEHFADLVKGLRKAYPKHEIIVIGIAGEDSWIPDGIDGVTSLCGKLSILETAAIINRLEFLVTNDSGNAHIAGACGVPSFVIFGPTSAVKNHPWKNSTIITRGLECSPCQFTRNGPHNWPTCKHRECMDITAAQVIDIIKEKRKTPEIAIVVNTYNRYDMIVAFLNNIMAWKGLHDVRLIVIDDHSDGERIRNLINSFRAPFESLGNELVFIEHDYNYGKQQFAQSIQEGIDAATGCQYTMFTSEDVISNHETLLEIRTAFPLLNDDIQCVNFFMDTRVNMNDGKGFYSSRGKANAKFDFVKWNDGFLTLYRTAFLEQIKIYGKPSEMGSGCWFCVNDFIIRNGLKQIRAKQSFAEHIGNIKSTMNNDWRKQHPIEAVNVRIF